MIDLEPFQTNSNGPIQSGSVRKDSGLVPCKHSQRRMKQCIRFCTRVSVHSKCCGASMIKVVEKTLERPASSTADQVVILPGNLPLSAALWMRVTGADARHDEQDHPQSHGHVTASCLPTDFFDARLFKSKRPWKRFQDFRQSYR